MTIAEQSASLNMKLLAHHPMDGFGNGGEGMGLQQTSDGRRFMCIAHESAPKNFTVVDVTDPRKPQVVVQTDLPHERVRSNSLDVVGDMMAVAYQTREPGLTPAGFELFDISDPEKPSSISFFDRSGPYSRGDALPVVRGRRDGAHGSPARPTSSRATRRTTSSTGASTCRIPRSPREVGRWWYPGTRDGDAQPPPWRHERFDAGYRAHNTNVYPERPDRALRRLHRRRRRRSWTSRTRRTRSRSAGSTTARRHGLHPHDAAAVQQGDAHRHATRRSQAAARTGRSRRGWSTSTTRRGWC